MDDLPIIVFTGMVGLILELMIAFTIFIVAKWLLDKNQEKTKMFTLLAMTVGVVGLFLMVLAYWVVTSI